MFGFGDIHICYGRLFCYFTHSIAAEWLETSMLQDTLMPLSQALSTSQYPL